MSDEFVPPDDGINFGKQGSLFPSSQTNAGLPAPIFPQLAYQRALIYILMMGREVNRNTFKPPGSSKLTNTDLSTLNRGIRRDCYIPTACHFKRVKIYSPNGKGRHLKRLAHILMTDEQRYHFELAFPNWLELIGDDKFENLIGKPTTKFARNLLEPGMFENGKLKCYYTRFFLHDKNFVLPKSWIPPELR